ncbi:ssDNA endodeoxyribonuclease [Mortierella sp. AD031]|nr:ssDNA endodeoxyribonuclease [Mortierella sp. AD031]
MSYNIQGRFSGRLQNARHLATMIKTVNFKDIAICNIGPDGIFFNLEESRCIFSRCLVPKSLFDDYKYVYPEKEREHHDIRSQQGSQFDPQEFTEKWPEGYDHEGRAIFGISLSTLLNCLNMFGTAGGSGGSIGSGASGSNAGKYGDSQGGAQGGQDSQTERPSVAPVTSVKMSYHGPGSKLYLTLEDRGVITSCGIPTMDPEVPVIHDFNEEVFSAVSMKSKWLEEGLRDLDATSDRVVLRLSPETPNFRISSLGTVEALDINYSLGDVLESCQLAFDHPIEVSYNFNHVLNMLRACPLSTSAYIAINQGGFLRVQFLHPVPEQRYMYSEYTFSPLETFD